MERKRRERINSSLEQLAHILKEEKLVAADKPVAKLEKADILELTVQHLKGMKHYDLFKHSSDSTDNVINSSTSPFPTETNYTKNKHSTDVCKHSDLNIRPTEDDQHKVLELCKSSPVNDLQNGVLSNDELENKISNKLSKKETNIENSLSMKEKGYSEGFYTCLKEVHHAIENSDQYYDIKNRLLSHLDNYVNKTSTHVDNPTVKNVNKRIKREHSTCTEMTKPNKKLKRHTAEEITSLPVPAKNKFALIPVQLVDGTSAFLLQGDTGILTANHKSNDKAKDPEKTVSKAIAPTPINHGMLSKNNFSHNVANTKMDKLCEPYVNKYSIVKNDRLTRTSEINSSKLVVYSSRTDGKGGVPSLNHSVYSNELNSEHYSISIDTNLHKAKEIPKIKTVTLPVGSTVTSSNTAKQTDEKTTINSFSEPKCTTDNKLSKVEIGHNSLNATIMHKGVIKPNVIVNAKSSNFVQILPKPSTTVEKCLQTLNTGGTKTAEQLPNSVFSHYICSSNLAAQSSSVHSHVQAQDVPEKSIDEKNSVPCRYFIRTHTPSSSSASLSTVVLASNEQPLSVSSAALTPQISSIPVNYISNPHIGNAKQTPELSNPVVPSPSTSEYPPTPPPSAPLASDGCFTSATSAFPVILPTEYSPFIPYDSNGDLSMSINSANMSPQSKSTTYSRAFSLLSTSVNLLTAPAYGVRREEDDEEFIDVENVAKEERPINNEKGVENCKHLSYDNCMWRPW